MRAAILTSPGPVESRPITVGEVRCTPDLRTARVYVTPLGGAAADDVVAALRRATPYLRGQIGRAVHLKYVPDLLFERDDTFAYAERIDALLRQTGQPAESADSPETEDDGT